MTSEESQKNPNSNQPAPELDEATNKLVEEIENFEMNSMPPDLKLAEMHRDCYKIGQAIDYRLIRSVITFYIYSFANIIIERRISYLPLLLQNKIQRLFYVSKHKTCD